MSYIEVVINIPMRPTFRPNDGLPHEDEPARSRTFHYSLPPELEGIVRPGHLVWAPFGRQTLKAIVIDVAESAPVQTRPIDRLARPAPVLNELQLQLAHWMAEQYVAPLSEAVKLFIPPGLMGKNESAPTVRAKREFQITALISASDLSRQLDSSGRESPQASVLSWFVERSAVSASRSELIDACSLKSPSALDTLAAKGLLQRRGGCYSLAVTSDVATLKLRSLRGTDRYEPVMQVLFEAEGPVWKSDLYARISADFASEPKPSLSLLRGMQNAGLIALDERIRFRDPLAGRTYASTAPPAFTSEQRAVWEQLAVGAFADGGINGGEFLLHGVTGSGKTEIYLRALAATLACNRQAVVLVPEIALTPQTVARFAGRFPGRVTVVHSGLSAGERYDVWRYVRDGHFDVVVGPRSALFAPFHRLGLIIVDEEHEASYKQSAEEWGSYTVFYDARAVARKMASLTGSALIFGSATPSLDAYYLAERGELVLLEMPNRVIGHRSIVAAEGYDDPSLAEVAPAARLGPVPAAYAKHAMDDTNAVYADMPPVEIVDMRQELRAGNRSIFSRAMAGELHATLDAGEQAILFLNRRGTATFVMCRDCGAVVECKRCEIPFTYHERAQMLICHHCNRRVPIPDHCPNVECGSKRIKYFGSGTQKIEEYVRQVAPRAQIVRWDADSVVRKGRHEVILDQFLRGEANVLVGTQMIAKGLDLPMVTLVGVIAADVGLYLPDFRSAERTFQLLTQVAGRAGRSARGGRVVVQTYSPDHYAIRAAAAHNYEQFYAQEMQFRNEHQYPPVRRLARLI